MTLTMTIKGILAGLVSVRAVAMVSPCRCWMRRLHRWWPGGSFLPWDARFLSNSSDDPWVISSVKRAPCGIGETLACWPVQQGQAAYGIGFLGQFGLQIVGVLAYGHFAVSHILRSLVDDFGGFPEVSG